VLNTASEYFQLHRAHRIALRGVRRHSHHHQGRGHTLANVIFLAVGALVANVLGTTGASMLLIRPWLRANKYRVTAHHVVFLHFYRVQRRRLPHSRG